MYSGSCRNPDKIRHKLYWNMQNIFLNLKAPTLTFGGRLCDLISTSLLCGLIECRGSR